jgi:superfamily I DNA/RNA helicase
MEQVFIKLERELSRVLVRASKDMKCSLQEAKESEEYLTYVDKVDAIRIIADDIVKAESVINRIKGIFLDNSSGIALSTIHRSKGLECDRVFILCPDKLFHAPAMTLQWSAEQEENLVYVAYTRAKHYLGFIRDYEWGGVKKVS